SGRRRVSRFDDNAGRIYEPAVLRILVAALLFSHAAVLGALAGPSPTGLRMLLTAEATLVVGWLVLLMLMLWPGVSGWLRRCTVVLDATLASLFLPFAGPGAAGADTPFRLRL